MRVQRGVARSVQRDETGVTGSLRQVGAAGTASPRLGLDWHRDNVVIDGEGVSGTHSAMLLTADFIAKLQSRHHNGSSTRNNSNNNNNNNNHADSLSAAAKLQGTASSAVTTQPPLFAYLAFHMIHEADGTANPPASVCHSAKCMEAPPSYSAPFAHNASDLSRRPSRPQNPFASRSVQRALLTP